MIPNNSRFSIKKTSKRKLRSLSPREALELNGPQY